LIQELKNLSNEILNLLDSEPNHLLRSSTPLKDITIVIIHIKDDLAPDPTCISPISSARNSIAQGQSNFVAANLSSEILSLQNTTVHTPMSPPTKSPGLEGLGIGRKKIKFAKDRILQELEKGGKDEGLGCRFLLAEQGMRIGEFDLSLETRLSS
jgi:hypothetical protein